MIQRLVAFASCSQKHPFSRTYNSRTTSSTLVASSLRSYVQAVPPIAQFSHRSQQLATLATYLRRRRASRGDAHFAHHKEVDTNCQPSNTGWESGHSSMLARQLEIVYRKHLPHSDLFGLASLQSFCNAPLVTGWQ